MESLGLKIDEDEVGPADTHRLGAGQSQLRLRR